MVNEEERDAFFALDITRLEAIWIQESSSKRYFTSENSAIVSYDVKWTGKHLGQSYEAEQKRVCHLIKTEEDWKFTLTIMMAIPVEKEETTEGQ